MIGQTLGHYHILEKIGEGGMGEVYRARDEQLERAVALKVLRPEDFSSESACARLVREAQAAAALNHPNICVVHEVGEASGRVFIAMELVEGRALRDCIPAEGLPVETLLRYGAEIAAALEHAHQRGIIHRDLKPANVAITRDGRAKVLDFGLAKRWTGKELEGATRSRVSLTAPGAIVGTLAYLPPETLRGETADARGDVWALGVVLYEMAAGRRPFSGTGSFDLTSAILRDPPPPLPASIPPGVRAVIERCLAKDPAHRYQSASEVRAALEAVHSGVAAALPVQPGSRRRTFRRLIPLSAALLLGVLAAGAYFFWPGTRVSPPGQLEFVQITHFTDSAALPALSPDGHVLAFIRTSSAGKAQLYVKLLPAGEPVELTHDDRSKGWSVAFSPDGARIAYTSTEHNSWDTWVVPVLGGAPTSWLANASSLTWIDEQRILFSEIKQGIQMGIVTSSVNRADPRDIYVPAGDMGMAHRSVISPDKQWVLIAAEMDASGWLPCRLVPFSGGSSGRRVGPPTSPCTAAAWSPDQKWMYFTASTGAGFHLWRQRFPDGEPEQLTADATEEEGIAMAPDGRSLITSVGTHESSIWLHNSSSDRQVTSEGFAYLPSFSPDGKKLYYLTHGGRTRSFVSGELWRVNLESGQRERLLPDLLLAHYSLSQDGKRVAFAALDSAGRSRFWLAALDGRTPPRELAATDDIRAFFGLAGELYFLGLEGDSRYIFRVKEDGSGREKLFPDPVIYLISVSPDGQWIVAWVPVRDPEKPSAVMAIPVKGGKPQLLCDACIGGAGPARDTAPIVSWSPDGRTLYLALKDLGRMSGTKTVALPIPAGKSLPPLPPSGIQTFAEVAALPGAQVIERANVFPSSHPGVYAYSVSIPRRNLYRIKLP